MVVAHLADLVEEGELRRVVLGDWRLDVLVVGVSLQLLQIFVVRAEDMNISQLLLMHLRLTLLVVMK